MGHRRRGRQPVRTSRDLLIPAEDVSCVCPRRPTNGAGPPATAHAQHPAAAFSVAAVLLVCNLLIIGHELGRYAVTWPRGAGDRRFSIGFWPTFHRRTARHDTEWILRLLLLCQSAAMSDSTAGTTLASPATTQAKGRGHPNGDHRRRSAVNVQRPPAARNSRSARTHPFRDHHKLR